MNKLSLKKVAPWMLALEMLFGASAQAQISSGDPAADAAAPAASDQVAPSLPQSSVPADGQSAATASLPDNDATGTPPVQDGTSGAAASGDGAKNRLIQEVVVTAGKREQNLQKVASSVQAFSGETLDAKGISDVKDLAQVTPGLNYDSMASYSIIFIRGIGGDAFQAGIDSSVATYIDGLYLPFTFSSAQALGDVKDIEVLKGPQGTLYGRNAIAGAITVQLKEPSTVTNLDILAQYGNYKDYKTKVSLGGAVPFTNNTLAASGSFLYEDRHAFDTDFVDPASKYHPFRNVGFRGALKWDPIEHTDIQASYYDLKSQDADSVATELLTVAPAFQGVLTPNSTPHTSGNSNNVGVHASTRIFMITALDQHVDWFDSKLILGHSQARSSITFDYDSAPEPVLDISALPNTAKSDSAELILTSNPVNTPEWLQWIGGFYAENTEKTGRYPVTVDAIALGVGTAGSAQFGGASPVCTFLEAEINFDCDANTNTNKNPLVQVPLTSGIYNAARSIYGQATSNITDQLAFVVGGRASTELGRLNYSTVNFRLVAPDGTTTPTGTAISYRKQSHTWVSFTPNAGLNFQLDRDILLYYKFSEAYKSGNFNGLNINDPPTRVEPELAQGNEAGFKTEWFSDHSLKVNGAVFTTTVTNAQEQTLSLTSGGVTSLQNAAAYTVRGVELEINWFALESLALGVNGDVLHGRYSDFHGRGFETNTTGLDNENLDFTGKHTVRTPTVSGDAYVNYTFDLPLGLTGEAASDVFYNSGFFYDPLNTVTQPSYYEINAHFSVFDPRSNIRLTAFGKNLNDAVVFSQKYAQDFGVTGFYGAPRTYGLTLTWSYK